MDKKEVDRMRGRKAQAAMEFLMTYGWAILVVLVVIGALAYFGVLSPGRLLPDRCNLPPGVSCDDYSLAGGQVRLKITNALGQQANITKFDARSPEGGVTCANDEVNGPDGITPDGDVVIAAGAQADIRTEACGGLPAAGTKQRLQLNITYELPTGLSHTLQGDLYTTIS